MLHVIGVVAQAEVMLAAVHTEVYSVLIDTKQYSESCDLTGNTYETLRDSSISEKWVEWAILENQSPQDHVKVVFTQPQPLSITNPAYVFI